MLIDAGYEDSGFNQEPTAYTPLTDGFRSSNSGQTFDLTRSQDFGPMTFTGQAITSSNFGTLGSSVNGLLENSFFDPYFAEDGPPSGTENVFRVFSQASWTDTLTYDGPAAGYFSNFVFDLSGFISGENAFNFVTIQHTDEQGTTTPQQWVFSDAEDYDRQLVSDPFFSEGTAEVTVTFQTLYQVSTANLEDGTTTSGIADFSNTLVLDEIQVTDQSGNEQPKTIITGDSGTQYAVAGVPEPSSALLAFSGLFLLMTRRRR